MPGFRSELPPGARATTARIRASAPGEASAVRPPKLWPTIPTGAASGKCCSNSRTSGTRLAIIASMRAARASAVSFGWRPKAGSTTSEWSIAAIVYP